MKAELKFFWARLNANYWFYPALFAGLAVALGLICIWLDRSGFASFLNDVEWLRPARPGSASNLLQVISGSMIAVASTVFSITIVAVSFASGSYGPRLLTNFMEDKGNQLSLATFIGTFVYALVVLRAVRAEDESPSQTADVATALPGFVPQLSLLVAFILMGISVAVLVFFLNHVPSSIRINKVIESIGSRLLREVKDTYPNEGQDDGRLEKPRGCEVKAEKAGYVQLIDYQDLERLARRCECEIVLRVRTGDFLHKGLPILEIANGTCDEDCMAEVNACFTQGPSRTPEQDPQFLIDELAEIALRALSPGINDPFTAVTALHWLGAATAELGCRDLWKNVCESDEEDCPVYPLADDFSHYVQRGFGSIRSAAATSPIACKIMIEVLENAAMTIDAEQRRARLMLEARLLHEQAQIALDGPDRREVEQRFEESQLRLTDPR